VTALEPGQFMTQGGPRHAGEVFHEIVTSSRGSRPAVYAHQLVRARVPATTFCRPDLAALRPVAARLSSASVVRDSGREICEAHSPALPQSLGIAPTRFPARTSLRSDNPAAFANPGCARFRRSLTVSGLDPDFR